MVSFNKWNILVFGNLIQINRLTEILRGYRLIKPYAYVRVFASSHIGQLHLTGKQNIKIHVLSLLIGSVP